MLLLAPDGVFVAYVVVVVVGDGWNMLFILVIVCLYVITVVDVAPVTTNSGEPTRDSPLHFPALGSWQGLSQSCPASPQVGF